MSKKYTLTEDQIKNFSIDVVKDFEGCPEALAFLKKIHKDRVEDLRNTRKEFMALINADKGIWIINFLMNLVEKEERKKFFEEELMIEISKLASKNLKKELKAGEVGKSEYEGVDKLLVQALAGFYKDQQENGNFTRSISKGVDYLSQAKSYGSIIKGIFIENYYQECVKTYSIKALDYVELFKK